MSNKNKFDEEIGRFVNKTLEKQEIDEFVGKKDVGVEGRVDLEFRKSDGGELEYHCVFEGGRLFCRCVKGEEPK